MKQTLLIASFFFFCTPTIATTPVTTFPWFEGFEQQTFPPTDWSIHRIQGTSPTGTWRLEWGSASNFVRTGSGSAAHPYTPASVGTHRTMLVSPAITIPATGEFTLEFWSRMQHTNDFQYSGVWISTTTNEPSAFTEVRELLNHTNDVSMAWVMFSISLKAYSEQTIYIAWVYEGNDAHSWFIDDVTITGTEATPISVETQCMTSLRVYPNPVSDVLHIQTDETIQQIVVLDPNGRVVRTQQGNHQSIDLQSLPAGHYMVKIHTTVAVVPVKIVKQ